MASNSIVYHLHRVKFDHRSLAISFGNHACPRITRSFQFLCCWLVYNDFGRLVKEKWLSEDRLERTILQFVAEVKDWNKVIFGNV